MNRTDFFRLLYIFCPRINKIFYMLYSCPTEICIITASTSDWIVQRGTALYNLQKERQRMSVTSRKKDRECVWRHTRATNRGRRWATQHPEGKKYTRRWTKHQCTEIVKPAGLRPIRSSTGRTAMTSSCSWIKLMTNQLAA